MPMTIEQCRAARALLGWSTMALADAAGLGIATVRRFETANPVAQSSVATMQKALERAGVVFLDADQPSPPGGAGVRLA